MRIPSSASKRNGRSKIVATKLKEWGCEVTTGIGKTGVVGTIRVGNNPRAIGLRADMDALPMDKHNTFDHRSPPPGPHACLRPWRPHDDAVGRRQVSFGHPATSTARLHFIFQPAEEGRGGAEAMVKDGLFEKFPCEQIFGMHNRPKLDVGKFAIRSGLQMAGGGLFDIKITGKGAHGARPGERHRPGDHRYPDHLGPAERGLAQHRGARFGGDLGHPDACRRRLQRHPSWKPCCAAPSAPSARRPWRWSRKRIETISKGIA